MGSSVVIDCFPERLGRYPSPYSIVAVDVIRTTTTALTATVRGRQCFPVATIEDAVARTAEHPDALLVGELGGSIPYGFDLDNSPTALLGRSDEERPAVLLSTSGTRLICGAAPGQVVYAACLRNWSAQVDHLVGRHAQVAVLGAGARGDFRDEDALCCAWIADELVQAGYRVENADTEAAIERWRGAPLATIAAGASAAFLRRTGRDDDLDFVLGHVNDVAAVLRLTGDELVQSPAVRPSEPRR